MLVSICIINIRCYSLVYIHSNFIRIYLFLVLLLVKWNLCCCLFSHFYLTLNKYYPNFSLCINHLPQLEMSASPDNPSLDNVLKLHRLIRPFKVPKAV